MTNKTSKISMEVINFIKSLYPDESPVPLHAPRFIGNEKKYVVDAIDSTFVSSVGKYVDRFEEMIWRQGKSHCGVLRLENLPRSERKAL